jgi:hypothetical protein
MQRPGFRRTIRAHSRFRPAALAALLAAVALMAVTACGIDLSGNDDAAAAPVQVNGDTLTWNTPWQAGDARQVSTTSEIQFSQALREQFYGALRLGEDSPQGLPEDFEPPRQEFSGIVTFTSADSDGAVAEFDASLEELIAQLQSMGVDSEEMEMMNAAVDLASQLDLAVRFNVGSNGAVTEVTNLDQLAGEIEDMIDSLSVLARLQGGSDEEYSELIDLAKILLTELPQMELVQQLAVSGVQVASGNMFLMRPGEYTVGQPVAVAGQFPTAFGLVGPGSATYELTEISDGSANVRVSISPTEYDIVTDIQEALALIVPLYGEDTDGVLEQFQDFREQEQQRLNDATDLLFQPYTVDLTIDTETGWVTAVSWSFEVSIADFYGDYTEYYGDMDPEDLTLTINTSSSIVAVEPES